MLECRKDATCTVQLFLIIILYRSGNGHVYKLPGMKCLMNKSLTTNKTSSIQYNVTLLQYYEDSVAHSVPNSRKSPAASGSSFLSSGAS